MSEGDSGSGWRRVRAGTLLGIGALLAIDVVVVSTRVRYGRDLESLRSSLTQAERERVDAIARSEESRLALAAELLRREALGDPELHLVVDTGGGVLHLERQGARLRTMPVRLGPAALVGTAPDEVLLAPPLGRRSVARVVDGSYAWAVPEWVWIHRGVPSPGSDRIPGALGSLAILLDSGAVIYARPAIGPLDDADWVMPGGVRADAPDLEAIRGSLEPGMAVYFH